MKLIENQKYDLKYSGEFCHIACLKGNAKYPIDELLKKLNPFKFIGTLKDLAGNRNIFYSEYALPAYSK